jgi:hypothetical protein
MSEGKVPVCCSPTSTPRYTRRIRAPLKAEKTASCAAVSTGGPATRWAIRLADRAVAAGGTSVASFVLSGTTLAGENSSYCNVCDNYTEGHAVFSIDLRSGVVLGRAVSPAHVQSLFVKPDGALAWIAASDVNPTTGFHEEWVYAHDQAGTRLLAHGSDIGNSSLALAGSTIYWTEGGKAFSAALS